jgi:hypothetical protein
MIYDPNVCAFAVLSATLMNSCFDGQNRGRRHNPKPDKMMKSLSSISAGAGHRWSSSTVHRPRRPHMCLIRRAARAPLGVLLLVIAVLWLGEAIHALLAADSAIVPGLGAGGAYLVGALGVALAVLALDWMVRGRTVVISQGAVAVTDGSLRGGRAWREPLANYREIRAYRELRTHRAGVRSWYVVRLWHPEPAKAIELARAKDPALIEWRARDWARRLGLPLSWQQDESTVAPMSGASGTGAIVPGSDIRPGALWEGLPPNLTAAGSRELSRRF